MTRRRWLVATVTAAIGAAPVRADVAPRLAASPEPGAFERELDQVFATDGLTADRAARRAAQASPALRRKRATVAAAASGLARARLAQVPTLAGRASYARLAPVDPIALPGAPPIAIPVDSYAAGAQVVVELSAYLARAPALIAGARLATDAARLDHRATTAAIGEQAREADYEWVRAQLQVMVARRQLVQVRSTLDQIRSLADVQRASSADVLRVRSQQAQARQVVDRLATAVVLRDEQLRLAIGAGADESLAIGEDVRDDLPPAKLGDLAELVARARDHRLELRRVDSGIRAKAALRRAEAAAMAPRLSAFGSVDLASPNPRVFPPRGELDPSWTVGVQLTWVLDETLAASATGRRLDAEADELRADRDLLRDQIQLEVLGAYQAVGLAERAIATSDQGVAAAEEGYRVRKDLLVAGRASVVEIVDAETELTRARIAALDARIDLRIARARLGYVTGAQP